jgi:hypothetical protein
VIIHVPTVWCLLARQLSQDVLADAGFVCNETGMLGDTIKGTFVQIGNALPLLYNVCR